MDGFQQERPDYWLNFGNPWEIERVHVSYSVKVIKYFLCVMVSFRILILCFSCYFQFYGTVEEENFSGVKRKIWNPGEMVYIANCLLKCIS